MVEVKPSYVYRKCDMARLKTVYEISSGTLFKKNTDGRGGH